MSVVQSDVVAKYTHIWIKTGRKLRDKNALLLSEVPLMFMSVSKTFVLMFFL